MWTYTRLGNAVQELTPVLLFMLMMSVPICHALAPICCYPDQFEASVLAEQGVVDMPTGGRLGYGYGGVNGSLKMAYDGVRQRTYIFEEYLMWVSVYPVPIFLNKTTIVDYANNVQYWVYYDGSCDTMDVDEAMYRECIPGNATLMSSGTLGDSSVTMRHYMFYDRIYLDPYQITVSVVHSENFTECVPVRMTYSQAYVFDSDKDVDISVADIVDLSRGIADPSVFDPPAACPNTTTKKLPTDWRRKRYMYPLYDRS